MRTHHTDVRVRSTPIYRQITVNDLPVGRSVDETIRLLQAFQFTVRFEYCVRLYPL